MRGGLLALVVWLRHVERCGCSAIPRHLCHLLFALPPSFPRASALASSHLFIHLSTADIGMGNTRQEMQLVWSGEQVLVKNDKGKCKFLLMASCCIDYFPIYFTLVLPSYCKPNQSITQQNT